MKPVDMRKHTSTQDGDCLMACVASILEIDLAELPEITEANGLQWYEILTQALADRGFAIADLWGDNYRDPDSANRPAVNARRYPAISPPGYAIAVGESPRDEGQHAAVALDGAIVHDPHPGRSGLVTVDYWIVLVPLARGARVLSQLVDAEAMVL